MSNRIARWSGVMAASLLALGAGAALAQPGPAGTAAVPGMESPSSTSWRPLKGQLGLNTSQQVMWDNAVAQTKAARASGTRRAWTRSQAALNAELAKPEPDFAAAAAVGRRGAGESTRRCASRCATSG